MGFVPTDTKGAGASTQADDPRKGSFVMQEVRRQAENIAAKFTDAECREVANANVEILLLNILIEQRAARTGVYDLAEKCSDNAETLSMPLAIGLKRDCEICIDLAAVIAAEKQDREKQKGGSDE